MNESHSIRSVPFGTGPDGKPVDCFLLRNAQGMEVEVLSYGGIIRAIRVPDRSGRMEDVVLGFDTLDAYLAPNPFIGALIGRYANRIGDAAFTLDGVTYRLDANNGPNHLHGGVRGFDKRVWAARSLTEPDAVGVVLRRTSADGEEGYPGELQVQVTYRLGDDNTLGVAYEAQTDAPTHVNLTQHTYFDLAGRGHILDVLVTVNSESIIAINEDLIPDGTFRPVEGTVFDFRRPRSIGEGIDDTSDVQVARAGGYDHTFVIRRDGLEPDELAHAARAEDPTTGRVLDVYTTEPGMQFYSGNFLDGTLVGKGGMRYAKRSGFCMETQHYPDTPNRPEFPSTRLDPGEHFRSRTEFRFSVRD